MRRPQGAPQIGPGRRASRIVVGTDITDVAQIAESIGRFGDRYLSRVFTPHELETCLPRGGAPAHDAAPRLAARFAAKEATRKILRPTREGVGWTSIEVRRSNEGWCDIVLYGGALELARRADISFFSVSLSHEACYATAVVVGERSAGTDHSAAARFGRVRRSAARPTGRIRRGP